MGCPIGLDKIHCQNCYFWRDGKCDYDAIMREDKRKEGGAYARFEHPPALRQVPRDENPNIAELFFKKGGQKTCGGCSLR